MLATGSKIVFKGRIKLGVGIWMLDFSVEPKSLLAFCYNKPYLSALPYCVTTYSNI